MEPQTLLILVAIISTLLNVNAAHTKIVNTTKGKIQGRISETVLNQKAYLSFQGIPYAKPPINELRFRAPVEIDPWKNVKQTIKDGSNCTQMGDNGKIVGSEDCLFINCFTPALELEKERKLKAVMIYIHGGGLNKGSSNQEMYGPDFLIEADVILVTFNYRLSAIGFLSLDHQHALGNAGLKDQTLALRWVKDNIRNFGGDPEKITIFGHSAGAACVDFHVLSDLSKGLFQQSISMSGSPYCQWSFSRKKDAINSAYQLGKVINNNKDVEKVDELLAMLKNASAADLISATQKFAIYTAPPFMPVVENVNIESSDPKFLTECYDKKYSEGRYNKGPHMTGFTSAESKSNSKDIDNYLLDQKKAVSRVLTSKPLNPISSRIQKFVNQSVSNLYNRLTQQESKRLAFRSMFRFVGAVDHKQRKMSRTNGFPVYFYVFEYDAKNNSLHHIKKNITLLKGVGHSDELPYFFHITYVPIPLRPNPEYERVRSQMIEMFTNFAKYGNPTPDKRSKILDNIKWLDSRKTGSHIVIGEKLVFKTVRPSVYGLFLYRFLIKMVAFIQSDCIEPIFSNWLSNSLRNSLYTLFNSM